MTKANKIGAAVMSFMFVMAVITLIIENALM